MRACKVDGRVGHLESQPAALHLRLAVRASAARWTATRRWPPRNWSRSKTKIGLRKLILDPAWTFMRSYFLQRGFLDGLEGLTIAYMAALYTFLKYAKARNMSPD